MTTKPSDPGGDQEQVVAFSEIFDLDELREILRQISSDKNTEVSAHNETKESLRLANEELVTLRVQNAAVVQLRKDHDATVREKENLDTELTLVRGSMAEKEKQLVTACEQIASLQTLLAKAESVQEALKSGNTAIMQVSAQLEYFVGAAKLLIPQNEQVYSFLLKLKDPLDQLTAAVEAGDAYRTPQEINLHAETEALHKVLLDAQILLAKMQEAKSAPVAPPLLHVVPDPPPASAGQMVRDGFSLFRTVRSTIVWLHRFVISASILALGGGLLALVAFGLFIAWAIWG